MIENLVEHFEIWKPDQCIVGVKAIMRRVNRIKPRVYLEIGCAKLGTFRLYESLLPPSPRGLAIGVDTVKPTKEQVESGQAQCLWEDYKPISGCDVCLVEGDSQDKDVIKRVINELTGRKVDFLFIDGLHTYEGIKADWNNYASLVRSNGVVAFHDFDVHRYRDNMSKFIYELKKDGWIVEIPPYETIATVIVNMM